MTNNEIISKLMKKTSYDLGDLLEIMRLLRAPEGCPWDREQDHHSIRSALIEETYEVIEAIDNDDSVLLREELGDLLFQIVFHAELEDEAGRFDLSGVIDDISKKMIHRHPHVFGSLHVENSGEVLQNWEAIKTEEKHRNTLVEKLRAVPPMMPALMRASKIGKKAGETEGRSKESLLDALENELAHLRAANDADAAKIIGAILMRTCDLSRALGVDAEEALTRTTDDLIDSVAAKSFADV